MSRNAEQVITYNNFMKYGVLMDLTAKAFAGSKSSDLNIYIDLYKLTMDMYEPKLEIRDTTIIVSSVINLCAHLRSYYWRFHKTQTKIFLVYSDMTDGYNKTFYPNYNKAHEDIKFTNDRITEVIAYNVDLLNTLCPYLPDIYFVKGTWEPSVIILDLIYKEEASNNFKPNLVIAREEISIQLAAVHSNTTVFFDSKRSGVSLYANNSNAIISYLAKTGRRKVLDNTAALDRIFNISPVLLGLLISLTNLPCRNVKSEYDINKAINIVYSAIKRGAIPNGAASNLESIYNGLFVGSESKMSYDSFVFRIKAVDILMMHREYMFTPYAKDISYRTDLIDDNAVRAINNEYFRNNPLDLNRL